MFRRLTILLRAFSESARTGLEQALHPTDPDDPEQSAGMEETIAAAKQVVSDVLAPIGQHGAIVVIPLSELEHLETDGAMADALGPQTPLWTQHAYVYGTAKEVTDFHAALLTNLGVFTEGQDNGSQERTLQALRDSLAT